MSKFTVVSTFSGCGGSSLGYKMAGGKVLLAVENNANAVATYKLNFPQTPIWEDDIGKLTVERCLELANVQPGELDILDGSPPCQGFSTAGKRDFCDNRNTLFNEFVRLLRGLSPRAFIMENVSGMVKGKMRLTFVECLKALKASGYKVSVRVLDAMYFGVPQSRKRTIFVGARDDVAAEPTHPMARSKPITVQQAIGDLPTGVAGQHQPQVIAAWHQSRPGQSLRKAARFVGSFQSCRLDPDKPSCTQVRAHRHWHYLVPRQLTDCEMARLGGFPDSYKWAGSATNIKERIGNSVPPPFMAAIAGHVRDTILRGKKARREAR